jgi:hypothetical protein
MSRLENDDAALESFLGQASRREISPRDVVSTANWWVQMIHGGAPGARQVERLLEVRRLARAQLDRNAERRRLQRTSPAAVAALNEQLQRAMAVRAWRAERAAEEARALAVEQGSTPMQAWEAGRLAWARVMASWPGE